MAVSLRAPPHPQKHTVVRVSEVCFGLRGAKVEFLLREVPHVELGFDFSFSWHFHQLRKGSSFFGISGLRVSESG